ncbi:MAG: DUF2314 domain-containing protein [Myxococcales bacterium]|nr:DUF2314 domain-containing protein [Myxococcales bacterium]
MTRVWLAIAIAAIGCKREPAGGESTSNARRAPEATASEAPAPSGAAERPRVSGSQVVAERTVAIAIYTPQPLGDAAVKSTEALLKERLPDVPLGAAGKPTGRVILPPLAELEPPSVQQLGNFGRGLDEAEKQAAAASKGALLFALELDADRDNQRLQKAQSLALELAKRHSAFVWDEITRELFTVAAWEKLRVQGWEGALPDVSSQITVHYYRTEGDRYRAITLGLGKLGVPDLVIQSLPPPHSQEGIQLVMIAAQRLVEGAELTGTGQLHLELGAVRHARAKEMLSEGTMKPGSAVIVLKEAPREEGDPDNRLLELRFEGYAAKTEEERIGLAIEALFGPAPDPTSLVPADDPELRAIGERARAKLRALAPKMKNGPPPREQLTVKAPFEADDGSIEWMWVSVTAWSGKTIVGSLNNKPQRVAKLGVGAKVEVSEDKIADYVWTRADGTKEGGESIELFIERTKKGAP